ncbi:helix-turn-helix domain-containing protein [Candidatus Soleaferrea massiliensis]|uniref:helix-turn-helix domain-containing protein n=1 Tax=Candidatus Soleaferrea massiliensis TaxID=1470354 RepID=UPI00058F1D48|nr:helix-turn-helix transcriptional regulator [Candidatus Soleaferrea massiliensis]
MKLYDYHGVFNRSGKRIRLARKRLNWSQELLAARIQLNGLNIDQNAVSRAENGKRCIPDFELPFYADALGVSILWLLDLED